MDDYDRGFEAGFEAAQDRDPPEPDRAFLKYVLGQLELTGDFWAQQVEGAMQGDAACAVHVLTHCAKAHTGDVT